MVRRAFVMPGRKSRPIRIRPGPAPAEPAPANPEEADNNDTHVPANRFSGVLKVIQKAPEDDATIKPRTIATVKMAEVKDRTLGYIRKSLNLSDQDETSFCYDDYSPAPDSLLLSEYLIQENEDIDFKSAVPEGTKTEIVPCVLFVAPAPEAAPKPTTAASTLSNGGSFAVMAYELVEGGEEVSRGALESGSLGASDPSKLTLAGLRKLLASATRMSTKHKFCTAGGMPAVDESMTFAAYLRLEATETDQKAEIPSVKVYYKLIKPNARTERKAFMELEQMGGKVDKSDYALTGREFDGGKTADKFDPNKERRSEIDIQPTQRGSSTNPYAVDAGYLTEGEWTEVMRNCGIMYGWIIDTENNRITRAPKPAFRLRMKTLPEAQMPAVVQEEHSDGEPSGVQSPKVSPLESAKLRAQELRKKVGKWNDASRLPSSGGLGNKRSTAGTVSAETRLRSGVPGGGSKDAKKPSPGEKAKQDGGKAETGDKQSSSSTVGNNPAPSGKVDGEDTPKTSSESRETEKKTETSQVADGEEGKGEKQSSPASWTPPQFIRRAVQEVACVLPSFQVNDDSRVEVTVSSHEFETSMARNDFSSSSTEGSMSGGYGGFAASVSAGRESQKSSGSKFSSNTYEKTMIAKYMIPRADIYLHPDDLEPTTELQEALERIRIHKNVADLRKLHQDFGQLWCQRVTVGGRLQSTKIMSNTSSTSEHQQKEAFKWSVGAQVTSPWVSASAKHTQGGGSNREGSVTDVIKNEKNVFEAVGGDTILVTNPELWAASVADFRAWRVIDRGSLSSLVDALSSIKGYGPVRSWFMQALPTLSNYIELPPSREVTVRLKVNSPTTQLSLSYLKQSDPGTQLQKHQQMDPVYYFGHTDECLVQPVENSVNMQVNFWSQMDMEGAKPLFSPQEYCSPTLLGFQGSQVLSDSDFANTLWTISAPFNEALQHEALVVIQTVASTNSRPLSLGVFRNQQGVFLPCLTDASNSGQQFWRILKTDLPAQTSTTGDKDKTNNNKPFIKQGDEIGLAWFLSDQTAGFRDFEDDVFGRRRFSTTADSTGELTKRLFLKLPWPRFEALQPGKTDGGKPPKSNSMVMSTELPSFTIPGDGSSNKDLTSVRGIPKLTQIRTLPAIMRARQYESQTGIKISDESVFAVQDITFRVDVVGGVGGTGVGSGGSSRRGDLDDGLIARESNKTSGDDKGGQGSDDKKTDPVMVAMLGGMMFLKGHYGGLQ